MMASLLRNGIKAGASTIDGMANTSKFAAIHHSAALIASREFSPSGVTPEEQSRSNQPKGNRP